MTERRSTKRRPRIVGVIASRADLERAAADAQAAGFIRTALGSSRRAWPIEVENELPKLRAPLIITARHPNEGGSSKLSAAATSRICSVDF